MALFRLPGDGTRVALGAAQNLSTNFSTSGTGYREAAFRLTYVPEDPISSGVQEQLTFGLGGVSASVSGSELPDSIATAEPFSLLLAGSTRGTRAEIQVVFMVLEMFCCSAPISTDHSYLTRENLCP